MKKSFLKAILNIKIFDPKSFEYERNFNDMYEKVDGVYNRNRDAPARDSTAGKLCF